MDYRGFTDTTKNGRTCQAWDSQSPHSHTRTVENYPDTGLGPHNYCRNPDEEDDGVWCYTTDPEERWEFCDVPDCESLPTPPPTPPPTPQPTSPIPTPLPTPPPTKVSF